MSLVATLYGLVGRYQHFERKYHSHIQDETGSVFLGYEMSHFKKTKTIDKAQESITTVLDIVSFYSC
jgi:hypothetical protein